MMYTKDGLDEILSAHEAVAGKCQKLFMDYHKTGLEFEVERAREYAHHGFCRRLEVLRRCIDRLFELLPPDRTEIPEDDVVLDATIYLQAFMFNVFGCIDNLAHVWVQENRVMGSDGKELPDRKVGFSKTNREVLESLPIAIRCYLTSDRFQLWSRQLANFRHALAHRIPLYILPFVVYDHDMDEFKAIGDRIDDAARRGDYEHAVNLMSEQRSVGTFRAEATHSFSEGAHRMMVHAQMLADFHTVEDLACKLLREL